MSARYCEALFDYTPEEARRKDELAFKKGDVIRIVNDEDPNWFEGELLGVVGYFPSNYVQVRGAQATAWSPEPGVAAPTKRARTVVDVLKDSQTKFGLWASYMAIYCGFCYILTGIAVFIWGMLGSSPPPATRKWTYLDGLVAAYAIAFGITILVFEIKRGRPRTGGNSYRGYLYLLFAIPGYWTLPTKFASGIVTIPALFNIISGNLHEVYTPPKVHVVTEVEEKGLPWSVKIVEFLGGQNPEGQFGRIVVLLVYTGCCFFAGLSGALQAENQIKTAKRLNQPAFTDWVALAKFFGWVMDLNYTLIFLPVCRTMIRWFYNNSADQSCFSRSLRLFLRLVPLDQAHTFHWLCAWVGFVSAVCHTVCHLLNYVLRPDLVWNTYGPGVWVTGSLLFVIILLIYSATHRTVKQGHFEIFWLTHSLIPVFIGLNIIHGRNWMGPNYWKWLLLPGGVFLFERCWRYWTSRQPASLVSFTIMSNNVVSISLDKIGALKQGYKEGQYAYLCCPAISGLQWHPFTISSAPQEQYVTFHIRVQGPGSWTDRLRRYLSLMAVKGKSHTELTRMENGMAFTGKTYGPDGQQLLRVYGPHSAPTQHLSEYREVMLVASGIGVTPLAASMKSIVHHRWRYDSGALYPNKVTLVWITSHNEIPSFRWLVRTLKEVDDAVYDLSLKNGAADIAFDFHVYVTSYKKGALDAEDMDDSDDVGFWGMKSKDMKNVSHERAPWTERQMLEVMMDPGKDGNNHHDLGHVHIHNGRPEWDKHFNGMAEQSKEKSIGVCFCGNPGIGRSLTKMCNKYTRSTGKTFHLHMEVF